MTMIWKRFLSYWPLWGGSIGQYWIPLIKGQVKQCFDVFFDANLDKLFDKQPSHWWFEMQWHWSDITVMFIMPPPLGAGGIMFSGCPSVRPSVRPKPEIPSFDLYIGPLVHPTNRNRFTACPSVRLSVRPSVRPSVRRGFRAFAGERMEGMAWNFTCWCILTVFRTD